LGRIRRKRPNKAKYIENLIRNTDVIGMTTTGAAKFKDLLDTIGSKIVLIEEAAEVLETHVIASLTKHTEQLILIGDHQQLRPQTADYEMSSKYNLNISLFERLIVNGMPFKQLKLQHRMRPEISGLLTPHIYKELYNHKSVFEYPNIRGLCHKSNQLFITITILLDQVFAITCFS
jgi:superfamily I DNA and/or RNA helicase